MLKSYQKNRKESNHGINLEEKTRQFVGKSSKNDCRYYKRIKKINKREFISRAYSDTGIIGEV